MKKIISAFLLLLLVCSFFGCRREETPQIVYNSRVLIELEPMSDRLVYAGEFQTPTSGASILSSAFPEHQFFGTLSQSTITMHETYQADDVAAEAPALRRVLGYTEKEYRRQINVSESSMEVHVWEDAILYCVEVPENLQYENETVAYAGKYLFAEYREKTGESYLSVLSPEELYGGRPDALTSAYHGRVDDRYYGTYGYYDLSAHEYRHYETAADLPPYQGSAYSSAQDVRTILSENALLKNYLDGGFSPNSVYFLGDRIYATVVNGGRYHSEGSEPYEGTDLWVFMLDATSGEILYAECLHLENYWQGSTALRLYRKGEDGLLYEAYMTLDDQKLRTVTVAETMPSCVAIEEDCFYGFDADGALWRILWDATSVLEEGKTYRVQLTPICTVTYPDGYPSGWNPQYVGRAHAVEAVTDP